MDTQHIEQYYTSTEHFLDLYDTHARSLALRADSLEHFTQWKMETRAAIMSALGITRLDRCPISARTLEIEHLSDHIREKILIQTEKDVWMPVYVLVPLDLMPGEERRCLIAPHGHESAGKFCPAGRSDIPALKEQIELYNYQYGLDFVRRGYIVFCPDARGFGERREWMLQGDDTHAFFNSTCRELNNMAIGLGLSLGGLWVWDLMRLIDYIQTRPDCDTLRLACTGLSGGGYQTLMLAALDERVTVAVSSGYFYGIRDSLLKLSDNCDCNYVPGLWLLTDMGDIGALIAPRPFLVESGLFDPLNGERGIVNVLEQLAITRKAYELLGVPENLEHFTFSGMHRWDGGRTYDFVDEHLEVAR